MGTRRSRLTVVPTPRVRAGLPGREPVVAVASVTAGPQPLSDGRAAASEGIAPPMLSVTTGSLDSHGEATRFPALGSEPRILDARGERELAGEIGTLIVKLD